MPYLALLGMLALWLTPALVARAEEPPSPAPAPPSQAAPPPPVDVPADYPEDFSQPDEVVAARENRYEAFGEDEPFEQPPATPSAAASSLNDPIE